MRDNIKCNSFRDHAFGVHLRIRHVGPDRRMSKRATHGMPVNAQPGNRARKSRFMSGKNAPFCRETRVFFDFRGKLRSEKPRKMQLNIQGLSSEFRIFRDRGNRPFFRAPEIRFFVPRKIGVFRDFEDLQCEKGNPHQDLLAVVKTNPWQNGSFRSSGVAKLLPGAGWQSCLPIATGLTNCILRLTGAAKLLPRSTGLVKLPFNCC